MSCQVMTIEAMYKRKYKFMVCYRLLLVCAYYTTSIATFLVVVQYRTKFIVYFGLFSTHTIFLLILFVCFYNVMYL